MQQRFRVEVVTFTEKNDDYIESNEQLDRCVKFDVREDSTVGVKIVELSRLNVSTSIDEKFSLNVRKTAEVPRTQFIDRVTNISVVQQKQVQQFKLCRRSCRLSRRPWRLHKCSSWTRLSRCPLWCNANGHGSGGAEDS